MYVVNSCWTRAKAIRRLRISRTSQDKDEQIDCRVLLCYVRRRRKKEAPPGFFFSFLRRIIPSFLPPDFSFSFLFFFHIKCHTSLLNNINLPSSVVVFSRLCSQYTTNNICSSIQLVLALALLMLICDTSIMLRSC